VMLSMLVCFWYIVFCEGYYSVSVFEVQGYCQGY
jgi:hypothetical protein